MRKLLRFNLFLFLLCGSLLFVSGYQEWRLQSQALQIFELADTKIRIKFPQQVTYEQRPRISQVIEQARQDSDQLLYRSVNFQYREQEVLNPDFQHAVTYVDFYGKSQHNLDLQTRIEAYRQLGSDYEFYYHEDEVFEAFENSDMFVDNREFISRLARSYNAVYHTNYSEDDFIAPPSTLNIERMDIDYTTRLWSWNGIFALLFLYIYCCDLQRSFSVYALQGVSKWRFVVHFFVRDLVTVFVIGACMMLWFPQVLSLQDIGVYVGYWVCVMCGVACFVWGISKLRLSTQLKNHKRLMWSMLSVYAVKCLIFSLCIPSLAPVVETAFQSVLTSSNDEAKHQSVYRDYGVFYPLVVGYDLLHYEKYGTPEFEDMAPLYRYLEDEGMLLFDNNIGPMVLDEQVALPYVVVNPNYLQQFPIRNVYGKNIKVKSDESRYILLLPERYVQYYDLLVNKVWIPKEMTRDQIDIYLLEDDQPLRTLDPTNEWLHPPYVVYVQTPENAQEMLRISTFRGSGTTDPLKIRLNASMQETYHKMLPYLKSGNWDDNLRSLVPLRDVEQTKMQVFIGNLIDYGIQLLLELYALVSLILYTVLLYIVYKRRDVSINLLCGVSFCRRYRLLLIMNLLVSVVLTVYGVTTFENLSTWVTFILLLLLDWGATVGAIRIYQRQQIGLHIKER